MDQIDDAAPCRCGCGSGSSSGSAKLISSTLGWNYVVKGTVSRESSWEVATANFAQISLKKLIDVKKLAIYSTSVAEP
jgi:hypothetical protein